MSLNDYPARSVFSSDQLTQRNINELKKAWAHAPNPPELFLQRTAQKELGAMTPRQFCEFTQEVNTKCPGLLPDYELRGLVYTGSEAAYNADPTVKKTILAEAAIVFGRLWATWRQGSPLHMEMRESQVAFKALDELAAMLAKMST